MSLLTRSHDEIISRSAILMDSPMSKTNIWLPVLIVAATITRLQAGDNGFPRSAIDEDAVFVGDITHLGAIVIVNVNH